MRAHWRRLTQIPTTNTNTTCHKDETCSYFVFVVNFGNFELKSLLKRINESCCLKFHCLLIQSNKHENIRNNCSVWQTVKLWLTTVNLCYHTVTLCLISTNLHKCCGLTWTTTTTSWARLTDRSVDSTLKLIDELNLWIVDCSLL